MTEWTGHKEVVFCPAGALSPSWLLIDYSGRRDLPNIVQVDCAALRLQPDRASEQPTERLGDRMQAQFSRHTAFAAHGSALSQNHHFQIADCSRILSTLAQDVSNYDRWQEVFAPIASRQYVAAQSELFAQSDVARCYHLVVSGQLLAVRHFPRAYPAVRFLTADDLFILDCDGTHIASCYAILDSQLLSIDRQQLTELARRDPELTRMLCAVHAAELEMLLQTPDRNGAADSVQQPYKCNPVSASVDGADCRASRKRWDGQCDRASDEAGILGLGRDPI